MNKKLLLALLCLCALLIQGCALVYVEHQKYPDGRVKHEYGVLGGLIPLYRYQGPEAEDDRGEPDTYDQNEPEAEVGK